MGDKRRKGGKKKTEKYSGNKTVKSFMLSTIPLAQDSLKTDSGFVVRIKKSSTVLPSLLYNA